ncbi:MAG: hypothetical protein HZB39_12710 [Planctomycetes bacterium]|nr:hypothetical protein [Planctomycetota bacterium]
MTNYEPRTIAFGAEILHSPMALRADVVQRIHNELYGNREVAYQNFQVAQDGIHLTNPAIAPGQISAVTFMPDRILLREELRGTSVEDFATRVVNVIGTAYRTLQTPLSLGQQFWVRSLINTQHSTDSRTFVADHLLAGGQEALKMFQRPVHSLGLRMTFPATSPETPLVNLRIEPWVQEPRSLWLEVVGQFGAPTPVDKLPQLGHALYSTYRFLTGPTLDYIGRFDLP